MPGAAPEHQGHLGDFHTKSTAELKDLLRRQESILRKPNGYLRSLPDGGRKVRAFADTLHRIITERKRQETRQEVSDLVEDMSMETSSHVKSENATQSLMENETQSAKHSSQFAKLRDKQLKPDHTSLDEDFFSKVQSLSVKEEADDRPGNDSPLCQLINTGHSQKVYVQGEHPGREWEMVNSYLKVIQKGEEASANAKQHFKPNSSLKIKSLEELPEKYRGKGPVKKDPLRLGQLKGCTDRTHPPSMCANVEEAAESAATPPKYKYDQAKVIPLDESFQLQKVQAMKQEELRAQHAAERLAGKIHVKMGTYNPEGEMVMAYRSQNDHEDDLDSDDNEADYPE